MMVVNELPPLFDEINAAFNVLGKPVIFAFGDKIFNPEGVHIPQSLIIHEQVHGARQGDDVEGWWRRYIDEPEFRLAEEITAHQFEYLSLIGPNASRHERRGALKSVAKRLSGGLYGDLISPAKAKKAILNT